MKWFGFSLFATFGFIFSAGATGYSGTDPGSGYHGKAFDFQALLGIIHDNSVSTLDQLIPLLPDNYKKYFVLMASSGSLQSASPTSPRVITFGNYQHLEAIYPGEN